MISVNIDLSELKDLLNIGDNLKEATAGLSASMAEMIKGRAIDLANQRLHSRRKMYIDGLFTQKVDDDTTMVSLSGKVVWIEKGMSQFDMLKGLLDSPKAKHYKDGSGDKYIIVPFDHSPKTNGPATAGPAKQDIMATIKSEMKKRNIPFAGIEKNQDGSAKMGRLHSFDITKAPLKMTDGPGMGHGPIGDVRQGKTGIPFLQGISVYQGMDGKGKAKRSIMTFRVASSRQKDQGKWQHPGVAPNPILDEAVSWAMEQFEKDLAPAIMNKILDF